MYTLKQRSEYLNWIQREKLAVQEYREVEKEEKQRLIELTDKKGLN